MVRREDYPRREQAYAKHYVLEHYLQQLALKIGNFRPGTTINYIDGFSGPWQHASDELRDTSPHVALTELCAAREALLGQSRPVPLRVRGMFVEPDGAAFALLQRFLRDRFPDVECATHCGTFEAHISDARRFATTGPRPFAFIFVDPKGWTGYGLQAIAPLLRVRPGEALINFMTKDIARFIDDEDSSALRSFVDLFGDAGYREAWRGLTELDREDRIVETYCARVLAAGGFAHCAATVILNPRHDRTHYHLVYATRSLHGLVAFRETERRASAEQREVRAEARQRARITAHGQAEMFPAAVMDTAYMTGLQQRYRRQARDEIEALLRSGEAVPFDALVAAALRHPLTSLGDLKAWLADWRDAGALEIHGLAAGERSLAICRGHRLRWCGGLLHGA